MAAEEMEWAVEAEEAGSEVDNSNKTQMSTVAEADISNKTQEVADRIIIREEETLRLLEATLTTRWEIAHKVVSNLRISLHLLEEALQISKLSCADTSNNVSKHYLIHFIFRRRM
jgi:hypothetical protein